MHFLTAPISAMLGVTKHDLYVCVIAPSLINFIVAGSDRSESALGPPI